MALTYILESILNEKLKTMQESWPFMKPVNRKQLKVYYEMIKEPMDLETVTKKVSKHNYHSRYSGDPNTVQVQYSKDPNGAAFNCHLIVKILNLYIILLCTHLYHFLTLLATTLFWETT